jgi:cellulose synthase (UDP-forming)
MADLSQTAVVLPANPGPEVTGLYLDLMGYFGAQTGYPALRVQVTSPARVRHGEDKDLLVLGTFADLSGTPEITGMLPLTYAERSFTLSRRARWGMLPDRLLRRNTDLWRSLDDGTAIWPEGLLEGIASPFTHGRSVVVIAGRDTSALPGLASALLTTMPLDGIENTVSLWTGGNFISYPLSTAVYGSGELPWYRAFGYWLPHHLALLLVLLLAVLGLLGWCTQRFLAAQIRERLRLGEAGSAAPKGLTAN